MFNPDTGTMEAANSRPGDRSREQPVSGSVCYTFHIRNKKTKLLMLIQHSLFTHTTVSSVHLFLSDYFCDIYIFDKSTF